MRIDEKSYSIFSFFIAITLALNFSLNASAEQSDRAMWVWEQDTRDALYNLSERETLLNFSQSKNIKTLYLYSDSYQGINDVTDNPDYYRSFINEARIRDMQVHALIGSMYLRTWEYILPEKRDDALAMVRNVLDYNAASSATERFDGFNVDIEPYILSDWWDNQPYYSELYLETFSAQKQLIIDSGQNIKYGPVIPRWYDGQSSLQSISWDGETKPLYQHIQDMSEYITIMDYQTTPMSIYWDAYSELVYADAINSEVVIGVETGDVLPSSITFYGYTEEEMEAVLSAAEVNLGNYASYKGYAIHQYDSYAQMAMVPEPSTSILFLSGYLFFLVKGFNRKQTFKIKFFHAKERKSEGR